MSLKAKNMKHHAKMRAFQRFGIRLDENTHNQIIKKIQKGEAQFIEKQSNRISLFWVDYNEMKLKIVYDKERKLIVTVMGREEWCDDDNDFLEIFQTI